MSGWVHLELPVAQSPQEAKENLSTKVYTNQKPK